MINTDHPGVFAHLESCGNFHYAHAFPPVLKLGEDGGA